MRFNSTELNVKNTFLYLYTKKRIKQKSVQVVYTKKVVRKKSVQDYFLFNSSKVLPFLSFQDVHPFAALPNKEAAAALGELKI